MFALFIQPHVMIVSHLGHMMLYFTSYVMFPLSRFAARLKSWSYSWTNRGDPIRSYQILRSIRGYRVNRRNFLNGSKFFYDQHDQLSNRDHRIRSYCIVTKRDRSHLIVLPNRGDRDRSWTR